MLYTFDLQIILWLQCKFQLNSPNGSGIDVKTRFSRWRLWWLFWISTEQWRPSVYIYWSVCPYIINFDLIRRVVCEEMSKIDFQDGRWGGHLGFSISTGFAIFDLEIILLLQCKFQLKSPKRFEITDMSAILDFRLARFYLFFI